MAASAAATRGQANASRHTPHASRRNRRATAPLATLAALKVPVSMRRPKRSRAGGLQRTFAGSSWKRGPIQTFAGVLLRSTRLDESSGCGRARGQRPAARCRRRSPWASARFPGPRCRQEATPARTRTTCRASLVVQPGLAPPLPPAHRAAPAGGLQPRRDQVQPRTSGAGSWLPIRKPLSTKKMSTPTQRATAAESAGDRVAPRAAARESIAPTRAPAPGAPQGSASRRPRAPPAHPA